MPHSCVLNLEAGTLKEVNLVTALTVKVQLSHDKKPYAFSLNPRWLIGILIIFIYIMFYDNPLYTLSNQVCFHCSFDLLELYGCRIGYLGSLVPCAQMFKTPMPKAISPY